MSQRSKPGAARAAQNQQVIKDLLKLNCNKICSDCKRNKHPRWASWNLGVFICIRCSGIHRGMGTHISRVKSVDLDSWTDEQLQSVLKWGNSRANKYWEAKLPPGHTPSEAKIENFIRTKYETKRWVMDGPMPDPSTLDGEADEDVPLAIVQEKAKLERSASQRTSSATPQTRTHAPQSSVNFFDDDTLQPPTRPKTTDVPQVAKPEQPVTTSKQSRPGDSLLGLDFFSASQSPASSRPSTTPSGPTTSGPSRPDLKQSILSLYASAPKAQATPQHERTASFASSTSFQSAPKPQSDAFGGLTDAFSGLSFPSTMSSPPKKETPFSAFDSIASPKAQSSTSQVSSSPFGGMMSFDAPSPPEKKPSLSKPSSTSPATSARAFDLIDATMGSKKASAAPPATTSGSMLDLFSSPPPSTSPPAVSPPKPTDFSSAFNLSSPKPQPTVQPPSITSTAATTSMLSAVNIDPWGGNAWSSDPSPAPTTQPSSMMKVPDTLTANDIGSGWGASSGLGGTSSTAKPAVTADEDFGGWASAMPNENTAPAPKSKPAGGFSGSDDLFSNVWE